MCFYSPSLVFTHSYTHTLMAQHHRDQFGPHCLVQGHWRHGKCRIWDVTRNLLITGGPLYHLSHSRASHTQKAEPGASNLREGYANMHHPPLHYCECITCFYRITQHDSTDIWLCAVCHNWAVCCSMQVTIWIYKRVYLTDWAARAGEYINHKLRVQTRESPISTKDMTEPHPISDWLASEWEVDILVGCVLSASPSPHSAPTGLHRRSSPEPSGAGDTHSGPERKHTTTGGDHRGRQVRLWAPGGEAARAEVSWPGNPAGQTASRSGPSIAPAWYSGWMCQSTSETEKTI